MNPNYTGGRIDTLNSTTDPVNTPTLYVCGSCGNDNEIKPKESIQCKECNGRIFYKKRTRRIVQYEAR